MRKLLTVLTIGCKANFSDSVSIVREAVSSGYEVVPDDRDADVVVINGCTVTHRADRDCRALVRRTRRRNPGASIVLTGCYARSTPDARRTLPEVDYWVSETGPPALGALLLRIGGGGVRERHEPSVHGAGLLLGHRRTFLKIQDGCDHQCAYCIVPSVRGRNRSMEERDVVEKAAAAEADGARELVLTGIHIGAYGSDRGEKEGLARLVSSLLAGTSRVRIRLSSIEPTELSGDLLAVVAGNPRVCPHFHVPVQSGSDRILGRMRRPYRAEGFAEVVGRIAERMPGCQIGTDVIAGFPGETREDFADTVRVLSDLPVHYLHSFPYSPRPGTESARWRDDVPPAEKKERVARLLRLDEEKRGRYLRSRLGSDMEVLVESADPCRGEVSGYAGNYVQVSLPGETRDVGELVRARADSLADGRIRGTRENGDVRG